MCLICDRIEMIKKGTNPYFVKELDVTNKTAEEVLDEAIAIIENTDTLKEYTYEKPSKDKFYSWVISNGLR